jgi:hypothetical protein
MGEEIFGKIYKKRRLINIGETPIFISLYVVIEIDKLISI